MHETEREKWRRNGRYMKCTRYKEERAKKKEEEAEERNGVDKK